MWSWRILTPRRALLQAYGCAAAKRAARGELIGPLRMGGPAPSDPLQKTLPLLPADRAVGAQGLPTARRQVAGQDDLTVRHAPYARWCGECDDWRWQPLPGGGHRTLADAQATLELLR